MKPHAKQYTVRGVSLEVDRVLRERAARQNLSVNQLILNELTKSAIGKKKFADFSDLVGRWQPNTEFDEVLESQRKIGSESCRRHKSVN